MSTTSTYDATPLPALVFGERLASVGRGFHGLVDQFSHLTPGCDYDTRAARGFLYKGNVVAIDSIVINQNYYSHMLAVSAVKEHNILIPLAGTHNGLFRGTSLRASKEQGFFIPANDRFQFETGVDEIAGSLIIKYDINRLNWTLQTMGGNDQIWIREERVRPLPLVHGPVNFKRQMLSLLAQIDALGGDVALLKLAGFDDAFYRLLALMVQPEHFLTPALAAAARRLAERSELMTLFEQYVEAHIEKPIALSDLESGLRVSARALQYACMKRHGCPPRTYIRNRKLDLAYDRIRAAGDGVSLSSLAFELGFSSQSQFSKFFRERFGVSPSQLLKA